MGDKEPCADMKAWRDLASKEQQGASVDDLVSHTPEGIDLKPLYSAATAAWAIANRKGATADKTRQKTATPNIVLIPLFMKTSIQERMG